MQCNLQSDVPSPHPRTWPGGRGLEPSVEDQIAGVRVLGWLVDLASQRSAPVAATVGARCSNVPTLWLRSRLGSPLGFRTAPPPRNTHTTCTRHTHRDARPGLGSLLVGHSKAAGGVGAWQWRCPHWRDGTGSGCGRDAGGRSLQHRKERRTRLWHCTQSKHT